MLNKYKRTRADQGTLSVSVSTKFSLNERAVLLTGDCRNLLSQIPDKSIRLVVTSPPYNLGKEYEQRLKLTEYITQQTEVIGECFRVLTPDGSMCWQVGNYVENGEIIPLDTLLFPVFRKLGMKMRNRIIWHFEHGLHCRQRFSGRYETIMWFTKSDQYVFNLDAVRIPQKYPGKKHFKGPKAGEYSGNPLGKNPGDLWVIPNVKNNHVEKTEHPCQYPVELIERLVLSMTHAGDWVLDPFVGTGSSMIAAIRHARRGIGCEIYPAYIEIARERLGQEIAGVLKTRPMNRPVYDPIEAGNSLTTRPWSKGHSEADQGSPKSDPQIIARYER